MSFYKEIAPFIDYIHSIMKLKTYISFDMVFPTKWSMPKSMLEEGETVAFQAEDQNYKGISFVAQIDELNVSKVLTKIAKVIKLNQERELKETKNEEIHKYNTENMKMITHLNLLHLALRFDNITKKSCIYLNAKQINL